MTDEQICRKIAESLGWKLISKGSNYDEQLPIWKSPEGNLFAKVPNFFTGPAARDLLVRTLVNDGWIVTITLYEKQQVYGIELSHESKDGILEGSKEYERLPALAYLQTIPDAKENK